MPTQSCKITLRIITLFFCLSLFISNAFARGGGGGHGGHGGGGHHGGSVSVGGYSRSNGTYVSGYNRSSPSAHHSGNSGSSYGSSHAVGYHSGGRHSGRSSGTSHLGISNHYLSSKTHFTGGTYKTTGVPMVQRSETAKREFLRQHGLTKIPPGFNIDHITPLSKGGSDTPSNMQLLSIEAHHTKTAAERRHY